MQNNIRKLRGKAGLSQIELAKKIGVSRYTIILLESEDMPKKISPKRAAQLCEIFNCSMIELYGMAIFNIPVETAEDKQKVIEMLSKGE